LSIQLHESPLAEPLRKLRNLCGSCGTSIAKSLIYVLRNLCGSCGTSIAKSLKSLRRQKFAEPYTLKGSFAERAPAAVAAAHLRFAEKAR
jgi:predicted RNA-binding Zn-ribbon protein involved in translation (DUF1610 family)